MRQTMGLTIRKKLGFGIGALSSILIIIGFISYLQIRFIDEKIREITEVEDPTRAAAYEMEINTIGTGMGVLKYLDTSDPRYRERVEEDTAEFKGFLDQYLRLAETSKEKELGKRVGNLFEEYSALGQSLMKKKDDQNTLFNRVALIFEKMDDIIDDRIQVKIDKHGPDGFEKIQESLAMEGDIAEVGTWLGNYLRTLREKYKKRIYDDVSDFKEELIQFKNLRLTEEEKYWAAELETLFNQGISDIGQIVSINDYLQKKIPEFIDQRSRIDDLLDDEIQILTHKDLDLAKEDAHRTANRAANLLLGSIIFALLFGMFAGWKIVKSITGPVDKLVSATEVISKGDLSHRIDIRSEDEFGVLAESFNRMTEGLRNTTVSRNQLESIINSMNESLMVISPDGRIQVVNPVICNILDYRVEELVGQPVGMIFEEELVFKASGLNDLMKKGSIRNVEKNYLTKDGRKIPVLLSGSVMHGDDGRIQKIVWVAMDISEQKATEANLRRTTEQLSVLLESLPVAVYVREDWKNLRLKYVSATIKEITGYAPEQFIEDSTFWPEHVHSDDRKRFFEKLPALHKQDKYRHEYRFRTADGAYRWLSDTCRIVRLSDGTISHIIGCCMDITEEKRIKQESDYRLQQIIQTDKLASLGEMVAGVGHEINNPHSFITYNIPLLEETWETFKPIITDYGARHPEWRKSGMTIDELYRDMAEMIQAIKTGSKRINRVVANLRQFALLDEDASFKPVQINEVIENAMTIIGSQIRKSVSKIGIGLAGNLPQIQGNFQKLEQVVANLMINAAHAIPEKRKGKISITTRYLERLNSVLIEIEDNGTGMEPGVMGRILEPFFTTQRDANGTGLGLSISYGLIREHNGIIGVLSRPGLGSRFTVFLPLDPNIKPDLCSTILCVDDDVTILNIFRTYFLNVKQIEFEAVHRPENVMAYLEEHPEVDIVLSDILMPGINGWELLEQVKAKFPLITVILYSGCPEAIKQRPAGCPEPDHILQKPFKMERLFDLINSIGRQRLL